MNSFVSVLLPIRNEGAFIARSLEQVFQQDYPADCFEVIVADGQSTDDTRDIVRTLQASHPNLKLIDNPLHIVPGGLNAAIAQARGDIFVRVDGHTVIAPDYVRQCVSELKRTPADNVGGRMMASGKGAFGEAVALATSSPFGMGGGRFHYSNQEEWVDTVYMGAWRREVFNRIGLFDEELVRNQDDEFNYRLLAHGGRILLSPRIKSIYTVRSTPGALWRQYFQYGFWKVRVLQKHTRQMRLRQFAPPVFVGSLLGTTLLAPFTILGQAALIAVASLYLIANLTASLYTARRHGWRHLRLLPVVFAILHLAYGSGFLIGLVKFFNRWGDKTGKTPAWPTVDAQPADLTRLRAEYARREQHLAGADLYSHFNPANLFMVQQRQRVVIKTLRQHNFYPLDPHRILELGCGGGGVLQEFLSYGAAPCNLHGIDLLANRIAQAHHTLPNLPIACADGQHMPYPSGTFDLLLQYTVFTSILDETVKANIAHNMLRVLKPGGLILWYDFWLNPTNPQTRGIRPAEIRRLFPNCHIQFQRITLAPPIARRLVPLSWSLCALLEKLQLFNSHYLAAIRPSATLKPLAFIHANSTFHLSAIRPSRYR